ncbi:MAG: hypothetical protein R2991_06785 [Thermoanaerobaculia bacterium]
MSQLMEWEVRRPDTEAEMAAAERLGPLDSQRVRRLLRRNCSRLVAPETLRQRILASLPHRSRDMGESRR